MKKYIILIFAIFILWFIIHTVFILVDGIDDELKVVDVAVVMGNKVETDGNPSLRLKSRLDKTIDLYEKGYFEYIIITGGVGIEGFDEAIVMKEYLISYGIPEGKIIVDNQGYNTYLTAKNSKEIMENKKFDSIMIISQYHHISRSKLIFSKVNIENVYSAHSNYFELRDIYSIVRDFFAYYKYLLLY